MNLRPRSSQPSSKGDSFLELSDDEEEDLSFSSDSDYRDSSHKGHDIPEFDANESNRRKSGPRRGRRKVLEIEEQVVEANDVQQREIDVAEVDMKTKKKRGRKRRPKPILLWEVWEEATKIWLDQHMTMATDLEKNDAETADAPPDLIIPLLRYQKEWLSWALKQEESAARGGILADEMGMGKTVQAIALVLAKRALRYGISEPVGVSTSSSTGLPDAKGTLVICPLIAVSHWVNEIDQFTAKGSNKVLVYHGANRGKTLHQFSEYDFVITTYSLVEAEYRKYVMPPKTGCQWCGKKFYERKLRAHMRYHCGPKKLGPRSPLLNTKVESDEENDKSKSCRKKSTKRHKKKEKLEASDSSGSPSGSGHKFSQNFVLHHVKWDRIILDEAHYIKDRHCNTTKAILALESSYKWALSGTPLQNRLGELYSLVRFLQITPYSYYLCKDCDCKILDYRPNSVCSNCDHRSPRHFCWWNKNIANPITSRGHGKEGRRAMILLKDKVLKSILLRRSKDDRAADLALPPRIISCRHDCLDDKEDDYYTTLYNESLVQFNTYVHAGRVMNHYAHIFDLLTRLRQALDHPYLVIYSKSAVERRESTGETEGERLCGLCHDAAGDSVSTSCAHVFCTPCLLDSSASMEQIKCPSCSKPFTAGTDTNCDEGDRNTKKSVKGYKSSSILNRIHLDDFKSSTKIDALKEEIRLMVESDGSAKGVVFSQFIAFLDLIHYSLQKSGMKCVQIDGSMSMGAREAAVTKFSKDADCRIILMSLKAGGIALNLTAASHVFLMEPWWNPAVERQAQARIHRIGQYKPTKVVRFVIKNTIEERILTLQEKKEMVLEGTVGGSEEVLGKLSRDDMRFLFYK